MSSSILPPDSHALFVCEGTFEQYLVETLVYANKLVIAPDAVVGITRTRSASQIQSSFLNFDYDWPVAIVRILDSRRENFVLGRLYRERYPVFNFYTHPEIEMLIIVREGSFSNYSQHFKSTMKPSEYCMQKLKLGDVKSREFLEQYWTAETLCQAIRDYTSLVRIPKGQLTLSNLLR